MGSETRRFYEKARKIVPQITKDRIFSRDIESTASWLKESNESCVQTKVGGFSID